MSPIEVIDMDRISVVVPYKLTAWHGKGNSPLTLADLVPTTYGVHVARGWALSNVKVVWRGLAARELRKGQFVVWRVNESPYVLEGGVVDTFVTDQVNALLAFSNDFDLDQNAVEANAVVYQQAGLAPYDAAVILAPTTKKGTRRA